MSPSVSEASSRWPRCWVTGVCPTAGQCGTRRRPGATRHSPLLTSRRENRSSLHTSGLWRHGESSRSHLKCLGTRCAPWPGGGPCLRAGISHVAAPGVLTTRSWAPRWAAWPVPSAGAGCWPGSLWRPTLSGSAEAAGRGWPLLRWRVWWPALFSDKIQRLYEEDRWGHTDNEHWERWRICCAKHYTSMFYSSSLLLFLIDVKNIYFIIFYLFHRKKLIFLWALIIDMRCRRTPKRLVTYEMVRRNIIRLTY